MERLLKLFLNPYPCFHGPYKYIEQYHTYIILPARKVRRLAQRVVRSKRDLSALWASRRASAQAVTAKWQLA